MKSLYLVDGSGYIFRAFYAIAPLSNAAGLPTNALFGFARMLVKLVKDVQAEYIAVTFDTGQPTFRHHAYDKYKANRAECPAELVPQMPYFRKIVQAFGMPCFEQVGYEADDIIATITKKMAAQGHKVTIVSGDKDLTQLVNDQVVVWDAMRDISYDRETVKSKFGVFPEQIIDYLALRGDSSDNIPGVKGIGDKTAQALVNYFGSIDAMLARTAEIENIDGLRGKAAIRKKIEEGKDALELSRTLVDLHYDVPPYNENSDIEALHWHCADAELLVPLFEELNFSKLVASIPFVDGDKVAQVTQARAVTNQQNYEVVTPSSLAGIAEALSKVESFAFDTETSSLDVLTCEIVGISLSWQDRQAYYLPLRSGSSEDELLDLAEVQKLLGPVFANEKIEKRGSNLKFDIGVLEENGFCVQGQLVDTMLASYVLHSDGRQHGLKALAKKYLNETMLTFEELVGKRESIAELSVAEVAPYACHDADASWRLSHLLQQKLGPKQATGASLCSLFETVEMPLVPVLSRMERNGIRVDPVLLQSLSEEFNHDLHCLEQQIYELAGEEFNVNSTKQLAVILFDKLGIPTTGLKKTKSGISTDASVLFKLKGQHPIVECLLEYRELFKLTTTYVDSLARLIHPKTGRIHASFNQAIAATGRLSSSDPNLQNIPIRNERGRRIRDAFIAQDGWMLISADYSQIELRVLAHLSGDKTLQDAFRHGEDIHLRTAKELFGEISSPDEMKEQRRIAKTINFGIIYGMSAFRLANELGISRKRAQEFIDNYFARYPNVLKYFSAVEKKIEQDGYVETLFGRRRYTDAIDVTGRDKGYVVRSLLNAPLQGTAAEIIKRAMATLAESLKSQSDRARMVLQVHDELVIEAREDVVAEISELVRRDMESAVELDVPLKVDVEVSRCWS